MNFSFYIYGTPDGFNTFPVDNSSANFHSYNQSNTTSSQLTVKRQGQLIYYAYQRNLHQRTSDYLGFCLAFNGVYCTDPHKLFSLFNRAFDEVSLKGAILKFDKTKNIHYIINKFAEKPDEITRIKNLFKDSLDSEFAKDFKSIPPSFKLGTESKTISINESKADILSYIAEFDCVFITSSEKTLSELERIHKLLSDLYTENETLKTEYKILNKQKKQYRWVSILSVAVIASLIGLYFLNSIILSKEGTITKLEGIITDKNLQIGLLQDTIQTERFTIQQKNTAIQELKSNLSTCRDSLQTSENDNSQLREDLASCRSALREAESRYSSLNKSTAPITITKIEIGNTYYDRSIETDFGSTIYSRRTMYLTPKITYKGIDANRTINLKIKWYNPDGSLRTGTSSPRGFTLEESIYLYNGAHNTQQLTGWGNEKKGHWGKGKYRIEIWYEDVCLKSKTFTIY